MGGSQRAQRVLSRVLDVGIEAWAKPMPRDKVCGREKYRVRHFSQGLAVGSRAWVEGLFAANKEQFGPKRASGARKLKSGDASLWSLRDLQRLKLIASHLLPTSIPMTCQRK
jgi:hypothetical protein